VGYKRVLEGHEHGVVMGWVEGSGHGKRDWRDDEGWEGNGKGGVLVGVRVVGVNGMSRCWFLSL